MSKMQRTLCVVVLAFAPLTPAFADLVTFQITGEVECIDCLTGIQPYQQDTGFAPTALAPFTADFVVDTSTPAQFPGTYLISQDLNVTLGTFSADFDPYVLTLGLSPSQITLLGISPTARVGLPIVSAQSVLPGLTLDELTMASLESFNHGGLDDTISADGWETDGFASSISKVPEPGPLALLSIGLLFMLANLRGARRVARR